MIQSTSDTGDRTLPPSSRPRNLIRNTYHVLNAVAVLLLVQYLLTTDLLRVLVSASGCAAAWSMELSRRYSPSINRLLMRLFSPVAHPDEANHINSATWYTTAIFLLALLVPLPAGMVGLAVLGLGDPAAAIVGKRWGRLRLANGRSLEGGAAFVVAGAFAGWVVLAVWHPDIEWRWPLSIAAATGGAVAELFAARDLRLLGGIRIDDNLVIPIAAALALQTLQWVMGA